MLNPAWRGIREGRSAAGGAALDDAEQCEEQIPGAGADETQDRDAEQEEKTVRKRFWTEEETALAQDEYGGDGRKLEQCEAQIDGQEEIVGNQNQAGSPVRIIRRNRNSGQGPVPGDECRDNSEQPGRDFDDRAPSVRIDFVVEAAWNRHEIDARNAPESDENGGHCRRHDREKQGG